VLVVFSGGGTGGHLYPALAIARALMKARPGVTPLFVGARRGIERTILPNTGFEHILLDLHPFYRRQPWKNWLTVRGMVSSWRAIGAALGGRQAAVVVATGGYASSATLTWCLRTSVPFVLQEQNSVPGQTNRIFSRWAREVYLGYPEAASLLHRRAMPRAIHTGNPIEPPPTPRPTGEEARRQWGIPAGRRVLLVFGGSQGSLALNTRVDEWIASGVPDGLHVLWATGPSHYQRHAHRASDRVIVRDYFSPIADAYGVADLALTRAGAMTTAELCAWGIPALLIPLPTAAADHQTANARALAAAGAAQWIPEQDASAAKIEANILALLHDDNALKSLAEGARARARIGAAEDIAARIARFLPAATR
jgi:UDP-N-acetylglucosamine--N-acetylmuramyl-(pentapeptide) pyrophosphoryl-undecaprenol N-acetylglucosamine transferase